MASLVQLDESIEAIANQIGVVDEIITSGRAIKTRGEKVTQSAEKLRDTLERAVAALQDHVKSSCARRQSDARRGHLYELHDAEPWGGVLIRRTPFAQLLLDHACQDRATREGRKSAMASPMFDCWTDGVFPPLAEDAERLISADGVRLHSHAAAVNSSMVFGLNLFLPFRVHGPQPLASLLSTATGLELRIERIQFEFGPSEILAETQSDSPGLDEPRTTSDLGIEVRDEAGRHGIVRKCAQHPTRRVRLGRRLLCRHGYLLFDATSPRATGPPLLAHLRGRGASAPSGVPRRRSRRMLPFRERHAAADAQPRIGTWSSAHRSLRVCSIRPRAP